VEEIEEVGRSNPPDEALNKQKIGREDLLAECTESGEVLT